MSGISEGMKDMRKRAPDTAAVIFGVNEDEVFFHCIVPKVGEIGRIWTTRVIWTTPTITALDDSRAISDIRETLRLMLGIL